MDDVVLVRRIECLSDLDGNVEQLVSLERLVLDHVVERLPLEQLHDDHPIFVMLLDVVDGANIWMVQRRSRARFLQKALQRALCLVELRRKKLDGDVASQQGVLRFVNHTHAAAAQLGHDRILPDGPTDHRKAPLALMWYLAPQPPLPALSRY